VKLKTVLRRAVFGDSDVGTLNATTRERWIERSLREIPAGSRILDAGAGEQQFRRFCGHLQYVPQDFGGYHGEGDGTGLQTGAWDQANLEIISDITSIPEPNGSFDAIMCTEVFEHIPDPIAAIREFGRLLKPGGELLITAPFASLSHFAPFYFYSGFSRYFYVEHLTRNGFAICELESNGNYFEFMAQELRRVPQVLDTYSTKGLSRTKRAVLRTCALSILSTLADASQSDNGSTQLLSFGIHVRAKKR